MSRTERETERPETATAQAMDFSDRRALVVSGAEPSRNLLVQILSEFGFGFVEGVGDVKTALASLKDCGVDLLAADLGTGRLEEADLVRNALAVRPGLAIVVVSGYATIEWGIELMKAGVRDVVRKPLDVPVLLQKVRKIFEEGGGAEEEVPRRIGPYEVLSEVERGGMGIIYRATDPRTEEVVALKVLPASAQHSMNQVLRFHREADAIARLDHPYIVKLKGNGFSGKRYYIAMEFIEGQALDVLAYESRLDFRRAAGIVAKVLEAVGYAHGQGVLHRDLKPSNVLVDKADVPHIIDFGLAQYMKDDVKLTKTGVVMGTIGYIAPERIRGQPATPASDVYSVGALLYECLTRKIPYETDSRVITVPTSYKQLVPLRTLAPGIPCALESVCHQALAVNPRKRYETAEAFREELLRSVECPGGGEPCLPPS
ncbi:MAG: protein kinase [Planctomycetes bacterium]|nr:protein kinase [Planctomycetota bacterium]